MIYSLYESILAYRIVIAINGGNKVVNGPIRSGPNPARARNLIEVANRSEKALKLR